MAKIISVDSTQIYQEVALNAPFFTEVASVSQKEVLVKFCNASNSCIEYGALNLGHFNEVDGDGNGRILATVFNQIDFTVGF